jgi:hypothetical protein
MTDFDSLLSRELDLLVPVQRRAPDWENVRERARLVSWRRPLVLAVAAALVVLGTAAAVTAALGGFHAWLGGSPGSPAPAEEQQRFAAANERTLAAFPKDTKLRELIDTKIDGKRYVLYGFRSGDSLCLRLKAVSLGHSTGSECASRSALRHAPAPILVVTGDTGFADRHSHPSAEASFGIAADGVARVDVHAVDGMHRAVVGGNAYLWVENEPNTGNRVLSVSAVGPTGAGVTVPLPAGFGLFRIDTSPERRPRGPTRVQARIAHPSVGWFFRREPRGVALSRAKLTPAERRGIDDLGFTRLVKPDPAGDIVVGLTGNLCLIVVHSGSAQACMGDDFFARGPLKIVIAGGGGFSAVAGVAADGVRRVVVFLADGERQMAALRDNLFTTLVAQAEFPIRVVAYDARGRAVGVETVDPHVRQAAPAAAAKNLRPVLRATGPNGATAVGRVGRYVGGIACWRVDLSSGEAPGACSGRIGTGPSIWVDLVQPAGRDLFLIGHVRWPIARVQLEFANGDVIKTRPRHGLYVVAIPRSHLRKERQLAYAVGYTSEGLRIHQRQGVVFRAPTAGK